MFPGHPSAIHHGDEYKEFDGTQDVFLILNQHANESMSPVNSRGSQPVYQGLYPFHSRTKANAWTSAQHRTAVSILFHPPPSAIGCEEDFLQATRVHPTSTSIRSGIMCMPPTTSTFPMGIRKIAEAATEQSQVSGVRSRIRTAATPRMASAWGVAADSAMPPPNAAKLWDGALRCICYACRFSLSLQDGPAECAHR